MKLDIQVAEAHATAGRAVVLCRTGHARRRAIAELLDARPGWEDVEVTTVAGFVRAAAGGSLAASPAVETELPEGHAWAERLKDRPRLRRLLLEHAGLAHRVRAVGGDLAGLSEPLLALIEAGWGVPEDLDGWRSLHGAPPAGLVPVGFVGDHGAGFGTGVDRATALLLGSWGLSGATMEVADEVLAAVRVPDVAAEARRAAFELADAADGLVLVADAATADRVVAALRRNGIRAADDGSDGLTRHALAALLTRLLPLFEACGEASLAQADLFDLLSHPLLSRRPHKGDLPALAEAGVQTGPRISVRRLRKLLRGTRRYHATPSEWAALLTGAAVQSRIGVRSDDGTIAAPDPSLVATAIITLGRARLLEACAARGTLAALADLITGFGLSDPRDVLGNALRAELRRGGQRPTTWASMEDVLDGALDSGLLPEGASVVRYQDYDGRRADVVVLLDVHHQGLGKAPAPDPFLAPASLAALGLPTPAEALLERLAMARCAATRAARSIAIVTGADATGRAVVPPVGLPLRFQRASATPDSYGLGASLPETDDRTRVFKAGPDADLAAQIDAEWLRAGHRFGEPPSSPAKPPTTLPEYLDAEDARPEDLRPWLGQVGPALGSEDGLPPEFRMSATRLQSFTSCLYKAWAGSVLKLKEPDPLEEDIGARDIGSAAHRVLELDVAARPGQVRWVVPEGQLEAARRALASAAAESMEESVRTVRETGGAHEETAAAATARVGLTNRWRRHWPGYAERRIQGAAQSATDGAKAIIKSLGSKAGSPAAAALCPDLAKTPAEKLGKAMLGVLTRSPTEKALRGAVDELCESVVKKNQPLVRAALSEDLPAEVLELVDLVADAWQPPPHPEGDAVLIAAEAGFGVDTPASLHLGSAATPVRGSVDALIRWRTALDDPHIEIVDFKTGGAASGGTPAEIIETFTKPQLPFYALVARAGLLPASGGLPVRGLRYDMVRPKDDTPVPVDEAVLDRANEAFGELMDRARGGDYPLAPHPLACPLTAKGYCDFQEACRLRAVPPPPDEDTQDGDDDSSNGGAR